MGTLSHRNKMARGPKRHLKRLNAPKHWMLDKMGGTWAPRPSTGPHKLRECLPLILMQRLIKVDGKVRTDSNFPCGFMDVISIEKTDEHFRMLYDSKGRFVVHRLNNKQFSKEMQFKLCRVQKLSWGAKGVPCLTTHDGRTIRYPDPCSKTHDTVKVDIATGKASDSIKFETGATAVITRGQNQSRVGIITGREKHIGSFEIVHVKDSKGRSFATRISNVFCIAGKEDDADISLPKGKGIRDNILEERKKRLGY